MVNWLRLNDTHLVLIILYATFFVSLGTLLMRTFIDQIPRELDEAALVDGASRLTILRRVIMPLSAQGMLAVVICDCVRLERIPLCLHLHVDAGEDGAALHRRNDGIIGCLRLGVLFAASTVQLLPIMLFVLLTQKHLVAGLTGGAIKG